MFINEEGEKSVKVGAAVLVEIEGILEMVADRGREVILLYEVDLPEDGYSWGG